MKILSIFLNILLFGQILACFGLGYDWYTGTPTGDAAGKGMEAGFRLFLIQIPIVVYSLIVTVCIGFSRLPSTSKFISLLTFILTLIIFLWGRYAH